jgi:hypothetical protein
MPLSTILIVIGSWALLAALTLLLPFFNGREG